MTPDQTNLPQGPWADGVLDLLAARDPQFAANLAAMSTNPWADGALAPRMVELAAVAINVAVTSLDGAATRRHMAAALAAGATADELLTIVKMGTVMSLHSLSLGAPILIEEAGAEAVKAAARPAGPTPAVDHTKAMGQWNAAWDPFLALDPAWTDAFMATGIGIYTSGVFTPKETELLNIAFDASITHMYAPGTRRHIRNALAAGASPAEIMAVLKICVSRGVESCNLGLPILAEALDRVRQYAGPWPASVRTGHAMTGLEDYLLRDWAMLTGREHGPLAFRMVLQPLVAADRDRVPHLHGAVHDPAAMERMASRPARAPGSDDRAAGWRARRRARRASDRQGLHEIAREDRSGDQKRDNDFQGRALHGADPVKSGRKVATSAMAAPPAMTSSQLTTTPPQVRSGASRDSAACGSDPPGGGSLDSSVIGFPCVRGMVHRPCGR